MRPLAEADLSAIHNVAFDVDDTLTTRGRLTPRAYAALSRLAEADIGLVAATGRPLGWADAIASTWPILGAVGENGAGWTWREGRALRHGYAVDEAKRRAGRTALDDLRRAVREQMPDIREATDQPARRCDLAFDIGEAAAVPAAAVDELIHRIGDHGLRATASSVHAHAIPGDWDKASGIRSLVRDALGRDLDRDRWLFVGDSGNDAPAFAWFEHTVGVANVEEHVDRLPRPPRWVTVAARGAGFVELADALLESRR